MAFISSASTVNVEATLTREGKKRLFGLIEGDGNFISRFTLGDSDTDYQAAATAGPLDSGHVPVPGDFRPVHRSYVLWNGSYMPGTPVIYIDNDAGPVNRDFAIGGNSVGSELQFYLNTEWPRGDTFTEGYNVTLKNPMQLSEDAFNRAFQLTKIAANSYKITFLGNLTLAELNALVGEANDSTTDIAVEIIGNISRRTTFLNVRLTY